MREEKPKEDQFPTGQISNPTVPCCTCHRITWVPMGIVNPSLPSPLPASHIETLVGQIPSIIQFFLADIPQGCHLQFLKDT